MLINTPISVGELIDKISILLIKKKNIKDSMKLQHIEKELSMLESNLKSLTKDHEVGPDGAKLFFKIEEFKNSLLEINSILWKIEDEIRNCERNKSFDKKFIELARAVYQTNDKRSEIKNEINNYFGSTLIEVKSYEKY